MASSSKKSEAKYKQSLHTGRLISFEEWLERMRAQEARASLARRPLGPREKVFFR